MITFQNTRTGRVVDIPEQAETNKDHAGRAKEWGRLKLRLEESKRWVRVTGDAKPSAPVRRGAAKKAAAKKAAVANATPPNPDPNA